MRIAELLLRSCCHHHRRYHHPTMSLETLLEAAKYLDYRTEANARGEDPQDFVTFLTGGSSRSGGGGSNVVDGLRGQQTRSTFTPSVNGHIDCLLEVEPKERRRTSGCVSRALGTREVHNKLEKNRRAQMKRCFESLKKQIPIMDEKKSSNLGVLRSSLRYIQMLKRKEREYEFETERLAKEKIALQQRLTLLKKELSSRQDVDVNCLLMDIAATVPLPAAAAAAASTASAAAVAAATTTEDTNSTSTATECGPLSDFEDDEFLDEEASVDNLSKALPARAPEATSKVRRTATELFRLLCDPPLSVKSLETQGPYIMCCQQQQQQQHQPQPQQQQHTLASTAKSVPPKVTREPSSCSLPATTVAAVVPAVVPAAGSAILTPPTATFIVQPTHRLPSRAIEQGPVTGVVSAAMAFSASARMQMPPLAFSTQIVPQVAAGLHFNGSSANILTSAHHSQPIQLLAQQTMRYIAAATTAAAPVALTNKQPVISAHGQSSCIVGTNGANGNSAGSSSSSSSSIQMIKMATTNAANGQSQMALAQLAMKPAALDFPPKIGVKGTSSSSSPSPSSSSTTMTTKIHVAQMITATSSSSSPSIAFGHVKQELLPPPPSSRQQQLLLPSQHVVTDVSRDNVRIASAGPCNMPLSANNHPPIPVQFLSTLPAQQQQHQMSKQPAVIAPVPPSPTSVSKDLASTVSAASDKKIYPAYGKGIKQ